MSKITGILIDVINNKASVVTVEDALKSYYSILHCDLIDIQTRRIGGRTYTIVCDDEGLLKKPVKISALNDMGDPMFVGNLFIVKTGDDYELTGLNDDDIKHLNQHIHMQGTIRFPDPYPMVHQVEYP